MDNTQLWSLVVGLLLPPILAVVQQPHWSSRVRAVVAFALAIVVGALTAYFAGDLNGKSLTTASLLVLVTAATTYKNLWKPTGVADAIESRTTFGADKPELAPATG